MASVPMVSVVIPTYNRLDRLRRVLAALAEQTYSSRGFEVIVVSDGSTDGTDAFLQSATTPFNLVITSQPNAGPAAARNRGVQLARGPLILFIDDDVIAAPGLIEAHVGTHEGTDDEVVVIGPMLTPPDLELSAWVRWEQAMLYKQYEAMSRGDYAASDRQFYTGNASVARASVLAIGGFDVRLRRAEDVELAYRLSEAGFRFVFNDEAIGYHHAERPFRSWLRNAHDYAVNDVVFAREYGRADVLERTRVEFFHRHRLVRWMTRVCVAKPRFEAVVQRLLRSIAAVGDVLHAGRLTNFALSGVYNITYYCGMARELGGASAFQEVIASSP